MDPKDIDLYLGTDQFTLLCNGESLHDVDIIPDDSNVQVNFSLPGSTGGFKSILRATFAKIEKRNREAGRDFMPWLKKMIVKAAEKEIERMRRQEERIERLKSKAPHQSFDFEYEKEISEFNSQCNDLLSQGMQAVQEIVIKTWFADGIYPADDFDVPSSDSELEEENSATGPSRPKKPKLAQNISSGCDFNIYESSQSLPGPSKYSTFVYDENSTSCDSKTVEGTGAMSDDIRDTDEQSSNDDIQQIKQNEDSSSTSISDSKVTDSVENKPDDSSSKKDAEKDDSPIDLLDFQSLSELEALSLERLISALMAHGNVEEP